MAELADAHGSGPCESNFMQVQVLLPAPREYTFSVCSLLLIQNNDAEHSLQLTLSLGTIMYESNAKGRHLPKVSA